MRHKFLKFLMRVNAGKISMYIEKNTTHAHKNMDHELEKNSQTQKHELRTFISSRGHLFVKTFSLKTFRSMALCPRIERSVWRFEENFY